MGRRHDVVAEVKVFFMFLMLWMFFMSITGTTLGQVVSLPNFPETVEYEYKIVFPPNTEQVAIFWYYGWEERSRIIYESGVVNLKCCTLSTHMYFPRSGTYILTLWYENDGLKVFRKKYTVRSPYRL